MTVEKQVNDLVINKMTKAQFDALENHSDTELYIVVDSMPVISYNDLTDKPSIGEGTLTIEKNGTSIGTFNANTNSNKTISFSVPTTVAELSDVSDYALVSQLPSEATSSTLGLVKPDGTTITVSNGVLSYANGNGYITADSPTLTGTPTAPTQSFGDNTTKIATTEFVQTAIDNIDALPAQSGNDGKYLKTNGTSASWENLVIPAVDQTYDGTSSNAQSGVAINGARFLKNTATGTDSLTILGTGTNKSSSINIGPSTSCGGYSSIAIGDMATTGTDANRSIAIGQGATSTGGASISIGYSSRCSGLGSIQLGTGMSSEQYTFYVGFPDSVGNYKLLGSDGKIPDDRINTTIARTSQIPTVDQTYDGTSANAQSGVAIAGAKFIQNASTIPTSISIGGVSSTALSLNVGGGSHVYADYSIALGAGSAVGEQGTEGIAIGHGTLANQNYSIQLGKGTNNEANSFYVGLSGADNYKLLGSNGKIPDDRLNTTIARTSDYYTKAEVDAMIGNIEAILQRLNSGNN